MKTLYRDENPSIEKLFKLLCRLFLGVGLFFSCSIVSKMAYCHQGPKPNISAAKDNNAKSTRNVFFAGKDAFDDGDCSRVIELLGNFFNKKFSLEHEINLVEIYRMLSICYVHTNKIEKAEMELENLLYLKKDYTFDPFTTPPPVIKLFQEVKNNFLAKQRELQATKDKLPTSTTSAKSPQMPHNDNGISYNFMPASAFVPFAYHQFSTKSYVKASIISGLQLASLGLNIASFWLKRSFLVEGEHDIVRNQADLGAYESAQTLQLVTIGTFLAAYIFGVVDALIGYRSEKT